MSFEERARAIEHIAKVLNGAIDVPGVSEDIEQTVLIIILTQMHGLSPNPSYADAALSLLISLPDELIVKLVKAVLPDFLETMDNVVARSLESAL